MQEDEPTARTVQQTKERGIAHKNRRKRICCAVLSLARNSRRLRRLRPFGSQDLQWKNARIGNPVILWNEHCKPLWFVGNGRRKNTGTFNFHRKSVGKKHLTEPHCFSDSCRGSRQLTGRIMISHWRSEPQPPPPPRAGGAGAEPELDSHVAVPVARISPGPAHSGAAPRLSSRLSHAASCARTPRLALGWPLRGRYSPHS